MGLLCPQLEKVEGADTAVSHTFVEIDQEIISTVTLRAPSTDSRMIVISYILNYVHEVPVNHLVKLALEKVWLGELTIST